MWAPAIAAAGVALRVPYNGRDTYASLLIHAGRNPGLVAAALGNGDTNVLWRHYAHVFDEARLAPNVPVEDAVESARVRVGAGKVYPRRTRDGGEVIAEPAGEGENPLS